MMEKKPQVALTSIEEFNKISDLRPYLLCHPDKEMVRASCLHYLGDKFQKFDNEQKQNEK